MPTDVANQIVGAVAFPFYSRLQKNVQEVTLAFKSILISVAVLLLPISLLMIAIAPTLINDVFGPDWKGTVGIIRVLLVVNIFDVLGETIAPILNGTGHPNKILVIETIQSIILMLGVSSLISSYGAVGAALAWLPATVSSQVMGLFFLRRILNKPFSGMFIPFISIGLVSLIGSLLAVGIDLLLPGWIGLVLATTVGILVIGGLLWILERKFAIGLSYGFQQAYPPLASWLGLTRITG
jgi:O-antigen/teichoic acid export membrane protein